MMVDGKRVDMAVRCLASCFLQTPPRANRKSRTRLHLRFPSPRTKSSLKGTCNTSAVREPMPRHPGTNPAPCPALRSLQR